MGCTRGGVAGLSGEGAIGLILGKIAPQYLHIFVSGRFSLKHFGHWPGFFAVAGLKHMIASFSREQRFFPFFDELQLVIFVGPLRAMNSKSKTES